jgi:3-hydroxybutyryl-CoA dehydrogenase
MENMNIESIFIVGSGIMGTGIAQTAIQAGYTVWIYDINMQVLEKARNDIVSRITQKVTKGKISQDEANACIKRLDITEKLDVVAGCQLVIEAVYENLDVKQAVYEKLETVCNEDIIIASNTSSLSISALSGRLKNPGKFIGMHFFAPVPVMNLLEITKGLATSDETYQTIVKVGEKLGKITITATDMPGFIINRILDPMINEAVFLLSEGIGSVDSIDNGMKFGCNHPMGPLELADLMGIDILLAVIESLYREFGDSKYRPAPLLKRMVSAGYLGKKCGKGFYLYDSEGKQMGISPAFNKK